MKKKARVSRKRRRSPLSRKGYSAAHGGGPYREMADGSALTDAVIKSLDRNCECHHHHSGEGDRGQAHIWEIRTDDRRD